MPEEKCPIVAFGASAGGLEAFAEILKDLPTDLGAAVVLILHLSPDHESMVSELLPRWTSMPVHVAVEGMAVERNHIYVIPPDTADDPGGGRTYSSNHARACITRSTTSSVRWRRNWAPAR